MTTLREIRKRIRTVTSISQVTRAMQTVSASRMRRAQSLAIATRPYATRSSEVLAHLAARLTPAQLGEQPLFQRRPVRAVEVVLITSSRGLCGGYNHNVIDAVMGFAQRQTVPVRLVTVGRKGRDYAARYGQNIVATFDDVPDRPSADEVRPLARLLVEDFGQGAADEVWLGYTEFVSTLRQRPRVQALLPVQPESLATTQPRIPYLFEPDVGSILGPMLERFVELQVYRAILESQASEHSARMVAMRSATDNAQRLSGELTLGYNKARQEAITKELIDIVGGAAALSHARHDS